MSAGYSLWLLFGLSEGWGHTSVWRTVRAGAAFFMRGAWSLQPVPQQHPGHRVQPCEKEDTYGPSHGGILGYHLYLAAV